MSDSLRQLRYFLAAVEEGQITAAARRLCLAQPALTQAIRSLEQTVGVELLVRHASGVSPTAAGERFAAGARATIAAYDRALADARALSPAARVLRVGAISCTPGLATMLWAFRAEHPDFMVQLVPHNFLRDPLAVASAEVDVAFVLPDYDAPGVITKTLLTLPVYICTAVDHRLAAQARVHLEDLGDAAFPGQHPAMADAFSDTFYLTAARGGRPPTIARSPLTPDETWALVASGETITTTPVGAWAAAPDLIAAREVVDVPPFALRVAWRSNSDAAVATFVTFIFERFGAQGWQRLLGLERPPAAW